MALCAGAALTLAGCKIVPIATEEEAAAGGFNAGAYAQKIWTEQGRAHFPASAKPFAEVVGAIQADLGAAGEKYGYRAAAEGSPWTFVVSGTGTVAKKNTESRAGTLTLNVEGVTGEVNVQIGPVIRGNAVRDALPFVSFKDFTNQLEFADVGKALTALALADVQADAEAVQEGQVVEFIGAMSLNSKSDKLLITPVSLKVVP